MLLKESNKKKGRNRKNKSNVINREDTKKPVDEIN